MIFHFVGKYSDQIGARARLPAASAWLAFLHARADAVVGFVFVLVTIVHRDIGLAQRGHRELIAVLVFQDAAVTFDPAEFHLRLLAQRKQSFPKIKIRRAFGSAPPVLLFSATPLQESRFVFT
jgi:hypothetical protein